ncbi:MAG: DUF1573 domain-containing protein [Phycisphaerales bacterium]|nr:DUF1573 domain-containing protein [Phycisphaerales bacterium]
MKSLKTLFAAGIAVALVATAVAQEGNAPPPQAAPEAKPAQPAPPQPAPPPPPPGQPRPAHAPAGPGVIAAPQAPVAPVAPVDPNAPQPKLKLSETVWDMGQVWAGEAVKGSITISNTGEAPMNVDVRTSCGCTAAKKPKNPLGVGESDTFEISYNTKKIGPVNQTVTVMTNDPTQPQAMISVKGEIKALYKIEPDPGLTFNRLGKNSAESREAMIINQYSEPLDLKVRTGQDNPSLEVTIEPVEAGMKWKVTARTKPPLAMGALRGELILDTGIERIKEVSLPIIGFVQPAVQVSPPVLYVPATATTRMERMVRVTYLPEEPVKILEVRSSLPSMTTTIQEINASAAPGNTGGTYELRVSVPPADELPESGATIEIETDAKEPEYKVLKVQVSARKPTIPVQAKPAAPGGAAPVQIKAVGSNANTTTLNTSPAPAAPAPAAGTANPEEKKSVDAKPEEKKPETPANGGEKPAADTPK